ncbi:MAG: hypothetical protein ACRD50_10685 [Candidatus Acidiferrales bacterium]
MKIRSGRILGVLSLAILLVFSSTPARGGDDTDTKSESSSKKKSNNGKAPDLRVDADKITGDSDATSGTDADTVKYVPALNGDNLIRLSSIGRRFQPFYGADLTAAYDNHLAGTLTTQQQGFFAVSPMVGFLGQGEQSQYIFQYSATATDLTGRGLGAQTYQRGNFKGNGQFNEHWGWDLGFGGWYGVDELQLLTPLTFTNLLNIPTANIQTAVAQLGVQKTLSVNDNVGLHWQPTIRDRFTLGVYHSYFDFPALSSHITYFGVSSTYSRKLTRLTVLNIYNEYGRDFRVNTQSCTFYNGGVGLNLRPRENTTLDIGAGPTIGTATCATQRGYNFHGTLGYQPTIKSTLYLTTSQVDNVPVNQPVSQTSTSFGAGYSRHLSRGFSVRLDGGYLHLRDVFNNSVVRAQGYFVAPTVEVRLTRSFYSSLTYRNMSQVIGTSSLARNQVLLTVTWRPNVFGVYQ